MPAANPTPENSLLVACFCAEWCGLCRDYGDTLKRVQAQFPQAQFVWIDVEDEADLMHPLDVENFPTLLLAVDAEPRFFGTVTPQAQTLVRLIRSQLDEADPRSLTDPELTALVARIRTEKLA